MRTIIVLVVLTIVCGLFFSECTYVGQTEVGFKYNVSSGKPVTPEENPLLEKGFSFTPFTINTQYFTTSAEIQEYTFTAGETPTSPYDEALSWDSKEGVSMSTDYTIRGRVVDPWQFYLHYGKPDYNYRDVYSSAPHVTDETTYEALRQAGQYAEVCMVEMTESMGAEEIRLGRNELKQKLIAKVRPYCEEFGFYIEDIIFPERFLYPNGNVIEAARQKVTAVDTQIRQLKQEYENALSQKAIDLEQADIEASKVIQTGQREADRIDAETNALAAELAASIEQVGPDATVLLKMAELNGRLSKAGVFDSVYVTEDSIFAAPFYGRKQGGGTSSVATSPSTSKPAMRLPELPKRTVTPHPAAPIPGAPAPADPSKN